MIAWRWPLVDVLEVALGAHHDAAAAGAVALAHAGQAVDDPGGREVGRRDDLHQLVDRRVRVLQQVQAGVDDLVEVVRRDVGRHADGDAARAVDQQVRQPRRQHQRLLLAAVVVGAEVDRLLVDVGEHLVRDLGEADLGVAHRRGVVAVDRAEVALAVDEHVAHREVLRHAHDRVVDRLVAVRVVLADDVADDARRLLVGPVPVVVQLVHREQHAAVHRLQAVARIGQGAADDHAHRVIEVRAPHLLFEADGQRFLGELGHAAAAAQAARSAAARRAERESGILSARGCSSDATSAPRGSSTGAKSGRTRALWHNDSVGGERPLSGGLPVFSDSDSDVSQTTVLSLERRIMKKLNKVASLFASAALAASMSPAFAQAADGRQLGAAAPACPGRTAPTNSAGAMASGRRPPACRGCDGVPAAARRRPGSAPPRPAAPAAALPPPLRAAPPPAVVRRRRPARR